MILSSKPLLFGLYSNGADDEPNSGYTSREGGQAVRPIMKSDVFIQLCTICCEKILFVTEFLSLLRKNLQTFGYVEVFS